MAEQNVIIIKYPPQYRIMYLTIWDNSNVEKNIPMVYKIICKTDA